MESSYSATQATLIFLEQLLNIPSPTGFHEQAIRFCEEQFRMLGLKTQITKKGALLITVTGEQGDSPRGLTAHVDTLGAMVSAIKSNGRLELTQLGGWSWGSVEGEGVSVRTKTGELIRGTILPTKASVHIYGTEARDFKREASAYEVRIDTQTDSKEDTVSNGIDVGCFIFFDPRVEIGDSGFIRSRHLDDKAGVACIYGALKDLLAKNLTPYQDTCILISNYEEVGHGGASGLPENLSELLAIDMAAAGGDQNSDEYSVGICVKDSGGPYHIRMREKLISLAEKHNIPYRLDIYPYYGSDGEAYWRAGGGAVVGLIGPGVDASHHYERTHRDSLFATSRLIADYLISGD